MFICIALCLVTIGWVLGELNSSITSLRNAVIRGALFDVETIENFRTEGIYYPSLDVACWYITEDQEEVEETINHEYLHYLIDEGTCYDNETAVTCKEHFCGAWEQ